MIALCLVLVVPMLFFTQHGAAQNGPANSNNSSAQSGLGISNSATNQINQQADSEADVFSPPGQVNAPTSQTTPVQTTPMPPATVHPTPAKTGAGSQGMDNYLTIPEGKTLYIKACSNCHDPNLAKTIGAPPAFDQQAWEQRIAAANQALQKNPALKKKFPNAYAYLVYQVKIGKGLMQHGGLCRESSISPKDCNEAAFEAAIKYMSQAQHKPTPGKTTAATPATSPIAMPPTPAQ